jgi:hypothetical protein
LGRREHPAFLEGRSRLIVRRHLTGRNDLEPVPAQVLDGAGPAGHASVFALRAGMTRLNVSDRMAADAAEIG